jgi:type IV pilus assembly protein PilO
MNLSEFQNLDIENVGTWPGPVKAIAVAMLCALIMGLGWHLDWQNQFTALQEAEAKEQQLLEDLRFKQRKASNLDALKQQLAEIKVSFGDMLKRLPKKTEVAALLVDISQQGLGAGLEFELFKPGTEVAKDFYIELPIQIRVTGNYHQFGQFVSGVADLPRIVTQHDIRIRERGKDQQGLIMEATAKTYRYLDEAEEAQAQTKATKP